MFARRIIPTAQVASRLATRRAHTVPETTNNPFKAFFKAMPMPVEAYPLAAIVVVMCSFATYSAAKHIREDRDHLRWYPGAGGVGYTEPQLKEMKERALSALPSLPK